jgi:hypothetical protein
VSVGCVGMPRNTGTAAEQRRARSRRSVRHDAAHARVCMGVVPSLKPVRCTLPLSATPDPHTPETRVLRPEKYPIFAQRVSPHTRQLVLRSEKVPNSRNG